ncbi:MAG: AzlC family ABC transporter permease [Lachnospiraceae bacterium]|nr:AzlC family ABC transporter permease [Lachnospiraceae bacterium]
MNKEFKQGIKDGIPIALGYFAVSFSLGIMAIKGGISVFQSGLMSLTNVTSAGQFAGIKIIIAAGTIVEMIMTQFIINLRYALMSLSLSQKLVEGTTLWQRLIIAFANTDEIFAVAMAHTKNVTFPYMLGLQSLPVFGWTLGTVLGCIAAELMPKSVSVAMSVALYGMFIAIVFPVAKKSKPVLFVAAVAVLISCLLFYVPFLSFISDGIGIIISTVIAAALGAFIFPVKEGGKE